MEIDSSSNTNFGSGLKRSKRGKEEKESEIINPISIEKPEKSNKRGKKKAGNNPEIETTSIAVEKEEEVISYDFNLLLSAQSKTVLLNFFNSSLNKLGCPAKFGGVNDLFTYNLDTNDKELLDKIIDIVHAYNAKSKDKIRILMNSVEVLVTDNVKDIAVQAQVSTTNTISTEKSKDQEAKSDKKEPKLIIEEPAQKQETFQELTLKVNKIDKNDANKQIEIDLTREREIQQQNSNKNIREITIEIARTENQQFSLDKLNSKFFIFGDITNSEYNRNEVK